LKINVYLTLQVIFVLLTVKNHHQSAPCAKLRRWSQKVGDKIQAHEIKFKRGESLELCLPHGVKKRGFTVGLKTVCSILTACLTVFP
jgi:hypothetical protein